jgi:cytochrome b
MKKMTKEIKVWDPLVRIFHWLLVASFFTAYFSEHNSLSLHVQAGFLVAGLVSFRVVWGFIGSEHARFRDFAFSPATVFTYLKEFVTFHARRYIGHSPAGGAMVVALLMSLAAIALTGMQLYAVAEHSGPFVAIQAEVTTLFGAHAGSKYFLADLHGFLVNLTLGLVFLHVSAVVMSSIAHNENLPMAMVTGKKRIRVQTPLSPWLTFKCELLWWKKRLFH